MGRSCCSKSCQFVSGLALAALLTVSATVPSSADDAQGSDGWRRTAQGWERIGQLHAEMYPRRTRDDFFLLGKSLPAHQNRWDFHPLLLVTFEAMAIAGAWLCWAARRPRGLDGNGR
jgi:hypothetical protein